jgi:transposase-like protein
VIAAEWPAYRDVDWTTVRDTMRRPVILGGRRLLSLELAAGNDEGWAWPAFVRSLVGLHGVRLVIFDDHPGLVKAIREQLLGSGWQRFRVHLTRNAQDLVPRSAGA